MNILFGSSFSALLTTEIFNAELMRVLDYQSVPSSYDRVSCWPGVSFFKHFCEFTMRTVSACCVNLVFSQQCVPMLTLILI